MQDEERVALGRIVMAHKEHMIMLEPLGKGLLGTTLRFDYEVRSEKEYFSQIPSPPISKDMVSLASHILQSKAAKFDPGKFKDQMNWRCGSSFSARPRAIPSRPQSL